MQRITIPLYPGVDRLKLKLDRSLQLVVLVSVAVHVGLLCYMLQLNDFKPGLLLVYGLNLLPLLYFLAIIWFDKNFLSRSYCTLSKKGISYRTGYLSSVTAFDWREVDILQLKPASVVFILKNEERHELSLKVMCKGEDGNNIQAVLLTHAAANGVQVH